MPRPFLPPQLQVLFPRSLLSFFQCLPCGAGVMLPELPEELTSDLMIIQSSQQILQRLKLLESRFMGHARTNFFDAFQQVSQPFDLDTKTMHSDDRIVRSIRSSVEAIETSLEAFVGKTMPRERRSLGMSNRAFDQLGKLPIPFGMATPTLSQ